MNRRTYLTAIGATASTLALAGCLSDDPADDSDDGTGPGDVTFSVVPGSFDADDPPVAYSVARTGGSYDTPTGPLGLTVELTNVADESLTYGERRTAQFQAATSADEQFLLYPGTPGNIDEDQYAFEDDCWNRTEPHVTTDDYQTADLEPGESHESPLVLAVASTESCPDTPPADIQFSTGISVWKPAQRAAESDDRTQYDWGFRLERD